MSKNISLAQTKLTFTLILKRKKKFNFLICNLSANKVSYETNSCSLGKLSYARVLTQNQSNLIKHLNFLVQNIVHSWGTLRLFYNKLIQNQIKIKLFKALKDAIAGFVMGNCKLSLRRMGGISPFFHMFGAKL